MREGTTSTGFHYTFDEEQLDDMRFVDVLVDVVNDDTPMLERLQGVSTLLQLLLGKDGKKALYAHIGERYNGRVPQAELERELTEIMQGSKELKNS